MHCSFAGLFNALRHHNSPLPPPAYPHTGLQAIFQKYKSQSFMNLLPVTQSCLSKVTTSLTEQQIAELLEMFLENGITEMESFRMPLNDTFYDSGKKGYNGITYGLVIDNIEANVLYLYENLRRAAEGFNLADTAVSCYLVTIHMVYPRF